MVAEAVVPATLRARASPQQQHAESRVVTYLLPIYNHSAKIDNLQVCRAVALPPPKFGRANIVGKAS